MGTLEGPPNEGERSGEGSVGSGRPLVDGGAIGIRDLPKEIPTGPSFISIDDIAHPDGNQAIRQGRTGTEVVSCSNSPRHRVQSTSQVISIDISAGDCGGRTNGEELSGKGDADLRIKSHRGGRGYEGEVNRVVLPI